ncbi:MAG: tRNA (pseudouridine(54)-N(1))-methyltransferase TrmY [archaeon]|nr:tRNA (pseudouridine(54)-N(1))-methyltransferase TrmY [archaeon]
MIRFVIVGHRAPTTGEFRLDDICGGAGRLDVLVRCINSAFFLSHDLRKDSEVYLIMQGGDDAPKTVRFYGPELRYLNPDERSTAALIRNALIKKIDALEVSSSPGVYVSKRSLREVVSGLSEKCGFVYLKEDGVDVRRYEFCDNPCFVLGDDRDLTREEENVISSRVCDKVSVGPLSLHADHCMIIVLNEIDRRQKEVFVGDVDIN